MSNFDTKDWAEVEAIQKMVAKDGLTESFFESGPQASGCLIYEILIDIFETAEYILIHILIMNILMNNMKDEIFPEFWKARIQMSVFYILILWSDFFFSDFWILIHDFWFLSDLAQELELLDLINLVTLLKVSLAHWPTDIHD